MDKYYQLVISDPVDAPFRNLPHTMNRKFRSFKAVIASAKAMHKKKCTVAIVEIANSSMKHCWEIKGWAIFPDTFSYLENGKEQLVS